jgi:uroporphyrin-3 C-methyltransferase
MNSPKPSSASKSTGASNPTDAKATARKNASKGVFTGVLVGLVLVAVALAAGLWWQQQRFEAVAKEVATRLQQSDRQSAQALERATQALTLASAQREVVDQLGRELSATSNELRTLQQAWEAANEGLDQTLLLNDLRRLITMANQELTLFGNVTSAVSILSSVQSMLGAQVVPALRNLQQAVIMDLSRLRALPQVDVANLSASLDSLIQLTGKAPLLVDPQFNQSSGAGYSTGSSTGAGTAADTAPTPDSSSQAAPAAEQSWWAVATDKVTQWTSEASSVMVREFADVMSIRKADDPQALLLSEEQAIQLRANVRAMLLSAQLALMTRQADIWRSELTEVQSLLNTRFDKQALDTKAALNLLGELLNAPVVSEVPAISDTLNALASADRVLSIPTEQAQSGDDSADSNGANEVTEPTDGSQPSAPGSTEASGANESGADPVVSEPTVDQTTDGNAADGAASQTPAAGQGS